MSYVIATCKDGRPYAVTACRQSNSFQLIALDSDVALNKIFSHPYRAGAQQILSWINKNDKDLAGEQLEVRTEAQFRK
jgi:hypothetical protein